MRQFDQHVRLGRRPGSEGGEKDAVLKQDASSVFPFGPTTLQTLRMRFETLLRALARQTGIEEQGILVDLAGKAHVEDLSVEELRQVGSRIQEIARQSPVVHGLGGIEGPALPGVPGAPPPAPGGGPSSAPPLASQDKDKSNGGPLSSREKPPETKCRKGGDAKHIKACKAKAWTLKLRNLTTGEQMLVCYKCQSWRHPGDCARWRLFQDFLRIREGLTRHPESVYIVLTADPSTLPKGRYERWTALSKRWDRKLKPRLKNKQRLGNFEYSQTWESTKTNRWPHVNMVLYGAGISAWCQVAGCAHLFVVPCHVKKTGEICARDWCKNCRGKGQKKVLCEGFRALRKLISTHAVAAGFGMRVWLAPVLHAPAMATYMNKMSMEITSSGVKDQLPVDAPQRFRRVRYSQAWPRPEEDPEKKDDWTGELVYMPVEQAEAHEERLDEFERKGWLIRRDPEILTPEQKIEYRKLKKEFNLKDASYGSLRKLKLMRESRRFPVPDIPS